MNAPLDIKMDKATFLRWASRQEGRWELVGGRPVLQESANRYHKRIAKNFERLLDAELDPAFWETTRGDLSAEIGEETRLPDIMVEPAGLDGATNSTSNPALLIEVLSPSSVCKDMNTNPTLYFKLDSLEAYVVASQDIPYLWVWQRTRDAARAFPPQPDEIDDISKSLNLTPLGIAMPLAEIYRGVFPMPPGCA